MLSFKKIPLITALMASGVLFLAVSINFTDMIGFMVLTFGFMFILFLSTVFNIFIFSRIQQETPDYLVGKVMGLIMAFAMILIPLGITLIGWLFNVFSNNLSLFFVFIFVFLILVSAISHFVFKSDQSKISTTKKD